MDSEATELLLYWGRFVVVGLLIVAAIWSLRSNADRRVLVREFVLILGAYLAYSFVRGMSEGDTDVAISNARSVADIEKDLGCWWEPAWQQAAVGHQWLVRLLNNVYIYGHWPLIAAVACWLFFKARPRYFLMRSAFLVSGALSLVIFALYPVAPPRLAEGSIVDTINTSAHAYTLLQPSAITNQYAAMPSLHFGWDLLVGIAIIQAAPPRLRWLGLVPPALMLFAIVATGNHYLLDAAAGAAISLFGLAVAYAARSAPMEQAAATASREIGRARDAFLSMLLT
jgi:hypothetical protein